MSRVISPLRRKHHVDVHRRCAPRAGGHPAAALCDVHARERQPQRVHDMVVPATTRFQP